MIVARPRLALETDGRFGRIWMKVHIGRIFQRFESGDDLVLQAFEPCFCLRLEFARAPSPGVVSDYRIFG